MCALHGPPKPWKKVFAPSKKAIYHESLLVLYIVVDQRMWIYTIMVHMVLYPTLQYLNFSPMCLLHEPPKHPETLKNKRFGQLKPCAIQNF